MSDWQRFADAANASPEDIERVKESARHVTEEHPASKETLACYVLELIGPKTNPGLDTAPGFQRLVGRVLAETEENLSDLLPEGYEVRIREWDSAEQ